MVQISHDDRSGAPEHGGASPSALERAEAAGLAEEHAAERLLVLTVLKGIAIAVPVMILAWVLLIVVAIGGQHPSDWIGWLGLAAGIGVLYGVFFGALGGFVARAPLLDDVDRHVVEMLDEARNARVDTDREGAVEVV